MDIWGNSDRYERRHAYQRQAAQMLKGVPYKDKPRLEQVCQAMIEVWFQGGSEVDPARFFASLEDIAAKSNGMFEPVVDCIIKQAYDLVRDAAEIKPTPRVTATLRDCIAYAREVSIAYTNLEPEDEQALKEALAWERQSPGRFRHEVHSLLGRRVPYQRTVAGATAGVDRGIKRSGWVQGKTLPE